MIRFGGGASAKAGHRDWPRMALHSRYCLIAFIPLAMACSSSALPPPVEWSEIARATVAPPDERIDYGPDSLQFGELRLPHGAGPFPIAVVIHGGCWLAEYDLKHVAAVGEALAGQGIASWIIEYRRVGDANGGWPTTFSDVALGVQHVVTLADRYPQLDTARVVLIGHSAGGHLALWSASGPPDASQPGDAMPVPPTLALRGIVSLAGITDLRAYGAQQGSCNSAVPLLLGGTPEEVPARYSAASPIELVPLRAPVRLIHGALDPIVPLEQSRMFAERSEDAGGSASVTVVEGAGHFDVIAPHAPAWSAVLRAARELLAVR
jgi:acetyl esterase/lipase